MVLGMTRDELFDAFSKFVSARGEAARPKATADGAAEVDSERDEELGDAVVVERAQPAKVHAKAKSKKRR